MHFPPLHISVSQAVIAEEKPDHQISQTKQEPPSGPLPLSSVTTTAAASLTTCTSSHKIISTTANASHASSSSSSSNTRFGQSSSQSAITGLSIKQEPHSEVGANEQTLITTTTSNNTSLNMTCGSNVSLVAIDNENSEDEANMIEAADDVEMVQAVDDLELLTEVERGNK